MEDHTYQLGRRVPHIKRAGRNKVRTYQTIQEEEQGRREEGIEEWEGKWERVTESMDLPVALGVTFGFSSLAYGKAGTTKAPGTPEEEDEVIEKTVDWYLERKKAWIAVVGDGVCRC